MKTCLILISLAGLTVVPAAAADLRPYVNAKAAQAATDACVALATASGWRMQIAVYNEYGELARFVGMDGASRTSGPIALAKARTAYRTGRSTRAVQQMDPSGQREFEAVTIAGGIPIIIDGHLAGAVAASGAAPDDDERCATAALSAISGAER